MLALASRDGQRTAESEAFAYATFILSIPHTQTEALTVFPGLGEDERVIHAVRRWKKGTFGHFFVTGLLGTERTARQFTLDTLQRPPFNLGPSNLAGVHTQVEAANTKVQAEWVADKVRELNVRSLTLTATSFHTPRAYGTTLRALSRRVPWPVALIPDPTPVPPTYISPEMGKELAEMIHGEYPRIPKYQTGGDVATLDELVLYIDWLHSEFI